MSKYIQPDLWSKELNAGNLEPLLQCYAEDAILFATFHPEPIDSPQGIRDYFTGFLAREGAEFVSTKVQSSITPFQIMLTSAPDCMNFSTAWTERKFDTRQDLPMLLRLMKVIKLNITIHR